MVLSKDSLEFIAFFLTIWHTLTGKIIIIAVYLLLTHICGLMTYYHVIEDKLEDMVAYATLEKLYKMFEPKVLRFLILELFVIFWPVILIIELIYVICRGLTLVLYSLIDEFWKVIKYGKLHDTLSLYGKEKH